MSEFVLNKENALCKTKGLPVENVNKLILTPFIGIEDRTFENFRSLKELDLSGNTIESLGAQGLIGLNGLTILKLANCNLKVIERGALLPLINLEYLDMSGNNFTGSNGCTLTRETFSGLISLKTLLLTKCNIHSLPQKVFKKLNNLELLDLSDNHFESVDYHMFIGLDKLDKLILKNCNLFKLQTNMFVKYKESGRGDDNALILLKYLDLSDNHIQFPIPDKDSESDSYIKAFFGLTGLIELNLAKNNITVLSPAMFLRYMNQLTKINISHNPIISIEVHTDDIEPLRTYTTQFDVIGCNFINGYSDTVLDVSNLLIFKDHLEEKENKQREQLGDFMRDLTYKQQPQAPQKEKSSSFGSIRRRNIKQIEQPTEKMPIVEQDNSLTPFIIQDEFGRDILFYKDKMGNYYDDSENIIKTRKDTSGWYIQGNVPFIKNYKHPLVSYLNGLT